MWNVKCHYLITSLSYIHMELFTVKTGRIAHVAWFKHILFITRHDKKIGQNKKLCFPWGHLFHVSTLASFVLNVCQSQLQICIESILRIWGAWSICLRKTKTGNICHITIYINISPLYYSWGEVNVNVNVHVYSSDMTVGSADCTIYTPGIGTHSFTVSSPLGRIQHLRTLLQL